jgi:hypothetical protein
MTTTRSTWKIMALVLQILCKVIGLGECRVLKLRKIVAKTSEEQSIKWKH